MIVAKGCASAVSSQPPSSGRPADQRLRGIALRIGAVCSFSIMFALTKLASDHRVTTAEIIFYRNLFGLPVLALWIAIGPGIAAARMNVPMKHFTRAVIGLTSLWLNLTAIAMLPLADATAIGFMSPLFATLLSAVVLRESVGPHRWAALAIGLAGVLLIVKPGGHSIAPVAFAFALGGALGVAAVTVTIRQIALTETATATVLWFSLISIALLAIPVMLTGTAHDPVVWALLAALAMFGAMGQMMMTASLRHAPVSVLAPLEYLQLIWATGLGWMLWRAVPDPITLAGAALIAAGGIYTIYREHRLHRERIGAGPPPA